MWPAFFIIPSPFIFNIFAYYKTDLYFCTNSMGHVIES